MNKLAERQRWSKAKNELIKYALSGGSQTGRSKRTRNSPLLFESRCAALNFDVLQMSSCSFVNFDWLAVVDAGSDVGFNVLGAKANRTLPISDAANWNPF